MQASKFKEAISSFDNVLSVAPNDTNTLLLKGLAQANLNDLKGAQHRPIRSAARSNSKLPAPHRELGLADPTSKLGQAASGTEGARRPGRPGDQVQGRLPRGRRPQGGHRRPRRRSGRRRRAQAQCDADARPAVRPDRRATFPPICGPSRQINEHRDEDAIAARWRACPEVAFGPHPDVLTYMGFSYRKLKQYD